jgi:hypothetical protein
MQDNYPVQQTEPNIFSLTNAELVATEEEFFLHLHSGNSIRRYHLTPKHMKRIALLIDKEVAKFEETNGELKTTISTPRKTRSEKKQKIGFRPK